MWKATGEDYSVEPAESIRPLCTLIDVGLVKTTIGNRVFGALKGALDGATFIGSPSPGRGGYEECVDEKNNPANAEETAFDKATCCSRKKTRQADGWTSSDDEAETVEQIDEEAYADEEAVAIICSELVLV